MCPFWVNIAHKPYTRGLALKVHYGINLQIYDKVHPTLKDHHLHSPCQYYQDGRMGTSANMLHGNVTCWSTATASRP